MMKSEQVAMNVYEVGDIIQMTADDFKLIAKQRSWGNSKRAVIMSAEQRIDKFYSYKAITDNGKVLALTPADLGNEVYVGHADLSMLFGGQ